MTMKVEARASNTIRASLAKKGFTADSHESLKRVPKGYEPDAAIAAQGGNRVTLTNNAAEAVDGAHVIYTDVWASMGQESEAARRREIFRPYQVDEAIMRRARPGAIFLHCLPAKRGQEVTDAVIESPQSAVFDQAENRLHAQKALLLMLMS